MNTYAVNARIRAEILATIYKFTDIVPTWDAHPPWLSGRQVGASESWSLYAFHADKYTALQGLCELALSKRSSQALS